MSTTLSRSKPDDHQEAQLLLPWYVNGTLPLPEHEAVAAHLLRCAACR